MIDLPNIQKAYFVGIGGIGMSALARYFRMLGAEVHGYDKTPSPLTALLAGEGMHIHFDDRPDLIPQDIDLVVVTPAVPESLRELRQLRKTKVPLLKRAEVLGLISQKHRTIAVAGTHGKTSVTALIAHLLHSGGIPVTAFIGGILKNIRSNCVISDHPEYVIIEADEYDRSFLQLLPHVAVITSIDADHLDIYGSRDNLVRSFNTFISKVDNHGKIFAETANIDLLEGSNIQGYGLSAEAGNRITNYKVQDGFQHFTYRNPAILLPDLRFHLPGNYNLKNAAAAISVALHCGLPAEKVRKGLSTFEGVERRFDIRYRGHHKIYIDDYAHHPEEIRACISAVRTLFPGMRLTGAFQPHLYSRTADFAAGFAESLEALDEIILLPIYPAREEPIPGITSEIIYDRMHHAKKYLSDKENFLQKTDELKPELFVTMGAGDIDRFVEPLKAYFEKNDQ